MIFQIMFDYGWRTIEADWYYLDDIMNEEFNDESNLEDYF